MNADQPPPLPVYSLPANRQQEVFPPADPALLANAALFLQQRYDAVAARDPALRKHLNRIRNAGLQAVVFGGWARDGLLELLHGAPADSRDIDLVVDGSAPIAEVLGPEAVRNAFGGVGIKADTINLDAWNLRETFLIRRHRMPVDFATLPATVDYTFNGVLFMPAEFFGQPAVVENGAIGAIQAGLVEFAAQEIAMPDVQAARAVILAVRMRFRLSVTVQDFLRDVCIARGSRSIVVKGIDQYCPADLRNAAQALLAETLDRN